MGHRLENLFCDELAEFNLALLVAGRAEAAALAREGQQVLVSALRAADAREVPVQDAALLEGLERMPNAVPQGPIGGREAFVIDLEELLEVPLDDLPER